jgi:hypothetical protein
MKQTKYENIKKIEAYKKQNVGLIRQKSKEKGEIK